MVGGVAVFAAGVAVTLTVVFGSDYQRALAPSVALLASGPPLAAYFVAIPILMAQQRARALAMVALAGAAVNVALDLALIPGLGIWGPVTATVAQNVVASVAILFLLLSRDAVLHILAPAVPACAAIGVLAAAPHSPAAIGAVLAVAIATALRATGSEPAIIRPHPSDPRNSSRRLANGLAVARGAERPRRRV